LPTIPIHSLQFTTCYGETLPSEDFLVKAKGAIGAQRDSIDQGADWKAAGPRKERYPHRPESLAFT